jgi:hypothetical protein
MDAASGMRAHLNVVNVAEIAEKVKQLILGHVAW